MTKLERFVERWPVVLMWGGMLLFWVACLYSEWLPVETLFIGPAMAAAGIVMKEYNKRQG
jgi:hypothetical protein